MGDGKLQNWHLTNTEMEKEIEQLKRIYDYETENLYRLPIDGRD